MLQEVFTWWLARIRELAPTLAVGSRRAARIRIEASPDGTPQAWLEKGRSREPLSLGAAARLPSSIPVILAVPRDAVLEKAHVLPTASPADTEAMLRHEIPRITPFDIGHVFWDWRSVPKPNDRTKSLITLTLVPKVTIAHALETLEQADIRPTMLEVAPDRTFWMDHSARALSLRRSRPLLWINAALAVVAVALPFLLQEYALYGVGQAIDDLRPAVTKAEAIRHRLETADAGKDLLLRETGETGDLTAVLARLTALLPDDTYLTDLSLRQHQLILTGRSASASNLIPLIAADPSFRNVAFDSPVTRMGGTGIDLFSIRAEVAP
jgi:general secretion pathway protein L